MNSERADGQHEAGMPGDGVGRREQVGATGVHPASAGWPDQDMPIRTEAEWGQGERGAAGYEDSGESEISPISTTGATETESERAEPEKG